MLSDSVRILRFLGLSLCQLVPPESVDKRLLLETLGLLMPIGSFTGIWYLKGTTTIEACLVLSFEGGHELLTQPYFRVDGSMFALAVDALACVHGQNSDV